MTLKPLNSSTPLSRNDIRMGRTRKEPMRADADAASELGAPQDDVADDTPQQPKRRTHSKRPMSGYLRDALRKR